MPRTNRRILRITAPLVGALIAIATGQPARVLSQQDNWVQRCEARNNNDRATQCEVRSYTIAASSELRVDAGPNGGVSVTAWDRNDVQVVARIQANAPTDADALALLRELRVETSGGTVRTTGPSNTGNRRGWSVSYEISVPRSTDLALSSSNGGLSVRGVQGEVDARTVNGGITLQDVAGRVQARTTNGGVNVRLAGRRWTGDSLDLSTTNGGITLRVPAEFNARILANTVNGGFDTDFPITVQGRIGRRVDATLGSGGPTVQLATTNGGIRLVRN